jgi:hypothetical protein
VALPAAIHHFDMGDRFDIGRPITKAEELREGQGAYRLQKKLKRSIVLKGLGFSRAAQVL